MTNKSGSRPHPLLKKGCFKIVTDDGKHIVNIKRRSRFEEINLRNQSKMTSQREGASQIG